MKFDEKGSDRRTKNGSKDKNGQQFNNKVYPGSKKRDKMDNAQLLNMNTARSGASNDGEDQNLLGSEEIDEKNLNNPEMSLLQKLQTKGLKATFFDIMDDIRNYEFFISHASSFKENWDFLIMITACYNVFMLPIGIAFRVENEIFDWTSQAVDMIFVLDIFIVFRTTILDDDSGEEIRDGKIIASKYVKGRFTVDFLSTVPFDYIALVSPSAN